MEHFVFLGRQHSCFGREDRNQIRTITVHVGRPPPGWPGDLASPEALSAADAKEASDLARVLDEYVLRCLFSKNWQLREAALLYMERQLSGTVSPPQDLHLVHHT